MAGRMVRRCLGRSRIREVIHVRGDRSSYLRIVHDRLPPTGSLGEATNSRSTDRSGHDSVDSGGVSDVEFLGAVAAPRIASGLAVAEPGNHGTDPAKHLG